MTIHVLVACSKSKTHEPDDELVWGQGTTIDDWSRAWAMERPRFAPKDLYSGRAARRQLQMVSEHPDAEAYLISAGAGLVRIADEVTIPPYECTFGRGGLPFEDWHRLPHGGLSNILLEDGDSVVAFAPRNYLRAISHDPGLESISRSMVSPEGSSLGRRCGRPVTVHPRLKEVLGVASADLNTELIRIFLEDGIPGIERTNAEAERLPPLPQRRRVDERELLAIVGEHEAGRSHYELVRYIRDELGVSASVERIGDAMRSIRG